jgi:hypothetical protein
MNKPAVDHFVRQNCCISCHEPAISFRDEESEQDFRRFGLCQKCLDQVFGPEPDLEVDAE